MASCSQFTCCNTVEEFKAPIACLNVKCENNIVIYSKESLVYGLIDGFLLLSAITVTALNIISFKKNS